MENQPKLTDIKEIITYLSARFPHCFSTDGEALPLKIGIFQDLVARLTTDEQQISKTQLRTALRRYTSSWRYLHGLRLGAQRVDLDGQHCGIIEQQHVEHAQQQLASAKQRLKQRQQQQAVPAAVASVDNNTANHKRVAKRPLPTAKTANKPSNMVKPNQQTNKSKPVPTSRPMQHDEIKQLQIGQEIAVKAGKSVVRAIILEIAKDSVRVQLSSGMAVLVRVEHLHI